MITVILINYNVKYFLEQSLLAVREALKGVQGEVIVVDNASSDGSRAYLEPRFPDVRFIWLEQNLGFSRANNLAFAQAKGDYILFLNPDTIIGERCLHATTEFLRQHKTVGALGVRMIDGTGVYLKESKRGHPTALTAFLKLSGLTAVFPRSRFFARYYMGHLDPNQSHEVEVLAGAFMLVRREVFEQAGGFDERFFMYGEDIDLSYRIRQLGYSNYYFADETIIHFKGETTQLGRLNYVRLFYMAMFIFVSKYYTGWPTFMFKLLLKIAIVVHAIGAYFVGLGRYFGKWLREQNQPRKAYAFGIVATQHEAEQISQIFWPEKRPNIIQLDPERVKNMGQWRFWTLRSIQELVICQGSLSNEEIIQLAGSIPPYIKIRFHAIGSRSIVGSDCSKMNGIAYSPL